MKLTGKQIKILREGILGAYPEEELVRFLHEEMDIVFSDIAQGENYSSKVYNLITNVFIAKERLTEFIAEALTDNPNSTHLQSIIEALKDILIQSLIKQNILKNNPDKSYTTSDIVRILRLARITENNEIPNSNLDFKDSQLLKILEKIDFKLVQEIYRDSLPKTPSIDIDGLMEFFTLEKLIRVLIIEYPVNQEKKPTILGFAFKLAKRLSDNNSKQELHQWINDVMEHNNLTFEVPNLETVEIITSNKTLCYFLQIIVEPLATEKDRFILKALLIHDCNPEQNSEAIIKTDWLESEYPKQKGFCFESVPTVINKIIKRTSEIHLLGKKFDLFIEIFLTIHYLSKTLDLAEVSDELDGTEKLGQQYPLIVRSYDRTYGPTSLSELQKKWDILQKKIQANPNPKEWEKEFEPPSSLAQKKWHNLQKDLNQKVGLKICSDFPTTPEDEVKLFRTIFKSGAPICLWNRKKSLEEDEMVKFNQLLTLERVRDINKLYQAIFDIRKEVPGEEENQPENHLGSNLGFLCDHGIRIPRILLPNISRLTRMV